MPFFVFDKVILAFQENNDTIFYVLLYTSTTRKDAGVVERAALEMRCTGNCTGGSNPSLSAKTNRAAGYGTYHKGNLQVILKLPLHFKELPQGTYLPATALPRENEPGKTVPHSAKRYRYLSAPAFRMRKGRPVPTDSAPAFIRPTKYGKRSTATETRAGTRLPEDYFMP